MTGVVAQTSVRHICKSHDVDVCGSFAGSVTQERQTMVKRRAKEESPYGEFVVNRRMLSNAMVSSASPNVEGNERAGFPRGLAPQEGRVSAE